MIKLGYTVTIEAGAGAEASFDDAAFVAAGADIGDAWSAEILMKINAPTDAEIERLHEGQFLMSLLAPALNPDLVTRLQAKGVTAMAMDAVPRISRAQALDVLSSMANIAGYRAVIEAANEFGSLFTGQVTAVGKVPPAKVLVIGAGVAGLAAIGTANSLGAIVRAFDARPEVAEQVESMGAEFLRIDVEQTGPSATGYAKEMGEDFNRKAAQLYAEQAKDVDIVITTALIPGKPAPRLLTEEMAAMPSMKPGGVAGGHGRGQGGGNVAGSRPDERVVSANGVTILGYTDLPGRLPTQASQLFGTNLVNLLKLATPDKDGAFVLNLDDEVIRGMTVCTAGELLGHPADLRDGRPCPAGTTADSRNLRKPLMSDGKKLGLMGVAAAVFLLLSAFSREPSSVTSWSSHLRGGHRVLRDRQRASCPAHPQSVTNAISGINLVGALLQVGHD